MIKQSIINKAGRKLYLKRFKKKVKQYTYAVK